MAHIRADRVLETTTTTGTGSLTLAGAVTGHRAFSAVATNNDTVPYFAWEVDTNGAPSGQWEIGIGTWTTGGILQRTTVLQSSNANALVNFAAGTKYVALGDGSDKLLALDDQNAFTLPAAGTPATPATGKLAVFNGAFGGRRMLTQLSPSGLRTPLQPLFGANKIKSWIPAGNSTTITAIGAATLTATGTATAVNVATTNVYTRQRTLEYLVTTAATTAIAGFRDGVAQFFRGAAAGQGGFFTIIRFGLATGVNVATSRCFVGMSSSIAAPTDVNPSTLTDMFGIGWDSADTTVQFLYNDNAGTASKISLGANFPRPTADRTQSYEVRLFCPPGGSEISYEVWNMVNNAVASGSVTTDIPAATTLLAIRGWHSVGGTSSVVGIGLHNAYIESDV